MILQPRTFGTKDETQICAERFSLLKPWEKRTGGENGTEAGNTGKHAAETRIILRFEVTPAGMVCNLINAAARPQAVTVINSYISSPGVAAMSANYSSLSAPANIQPTAACCHNIETACNITPNTL
jgi:hypothetical protein